MPLPPLHAPLPQVLLHPKWGSAVYPATMVTAALLPALLEALRSVHGLSHAQPA